MLALAAFVALALLAPAGAAQPPGIRCERRVAAALTSCVHRVGKRVGECYARDGVPCSSIDSRVTVALQALQRTIDAACPDAATVPAAGYGPHFTPQSLVERARDACLGDAATLAARAFGGPHGATRAAADAAGRDCLDAAYRQNVVLLKKSLRVQASCIGAMRTGRHCDPARVAVRLGRLESTAGDRTAQRCPDLAALVGLTPAEFVARTAEQARCTVATAHPDPAPLVLDCGPRPAVTASPRGVWTRIVLDEAAWGTRCGDGSAYSFWVRLAPAGSPIERMVVNLAGGGVCVFGEDCAAVSPSRFRASDDGQPSGGHLNTSAAVNPFWDWTLVHLPYCTQDLHVGGGVTNVFVPEGVTVHRFGSLNVRTTLRWLRDVVWAALDQEDAIGYRPGRLRVLFAGESAGAFGVQYAYHYLLDDLRWTHTTSVPDSGLALGNGELLGVAGLGIVMVADAAANGWAARSFLAPYCQASFCAIGPVLQAVSSARLGVVPEQMFLNVSNQVDDTQVSTTFFPNRRTWVNALRTAYCQNRGLPGIRSFLPAVASSIHTILRSNTFMTTLAADGEVLRDWLAGAVADPAGTSDRVDEGTLTTSISGVLPFPCALD